MSTPIRPRDGSTRRADGLRFRTTTSPSESTEQEQHTHVERAARASAENATSADIEAGLSDEDWRVRAAAASNQNTNEDHIETALDDVYEGVRKAAALNPSAHLPALQFALEDHKEPVRIAAASHHCLGRKDLNNALNDTSTPVRISAARNPALGPEEAQRLATMDQRYARRAVAKNPALDTETFKGLLADEDESVRRAAASSHHAAKGDLPTQILKGSDLAALIGLAQNEHLDSKLLDVMVKRFSGVSRIKALRSIAVNPKLEERTIDSLLRHESDSVSNAALKNPSLTLRQISGWLLSADQTKALVAAAHPQMSQDQLSFAYNNNRAPLRHSVVTHWNVDPKLLRQATRATDLREQAYRNPALFRSDLESGLRSVDPTVRLFALRNPTLTRRQIEALVEDPDVNVQAAAITLRDGFYSD